MAQKSDFTAAEWKTLLESAMMAGIAVTAADPSGLWGTLKESMASAHTILVAAHDSRSAELVKAVGSEYETAEGRTIAREGLRAELSGKRPAEIVTRALDVIKQAAAILDSKATADAPSFKAWLQHIAESVADAAGEGGFLGFGGVQVSDAEKASLAHIKESLGLSP
ncbi:MAG: hypothetical protein J2P49_01490 [Methylocapsa sp.]|nr:hypothetical protein [Methylocapsa sp.]